MVLWQTVIPSEVAAGGRVERSNSLVRSLRASRRWRYLVGMTIFVIAIFSFSVSAAAPAQRVLLPVPFQTQAPFANWTLPWKEACEEASIILTHAAVNHKNVTPHQMSQEILKMVKYQEKNWGEHRDLTVKETADLAQKVYNFKLEVKDKPSLEDLKQWLRDQRLVIVPTAGRLLKNPHFRRPGPVYHMVVLRGFDEAKKVFIVNDPGTQYGEGYKYSYPTLMNALHDWNGTDEAIEQGAKRVLVTKL